MSCSVNFYLIVCRWVGLCSVLRLFGLRWPILEPTRLYGRINGNLQEGSQVGTSPGLLLTVALFPWPATAEHTSTGNRRTLVRVVCFEFPVGSLLLSLVLGARTILFMPPPEWSLCFFQPVEFCNQIPSLALKSDTLGIHSLIWSRLVSLMWGSELLQTLVLFFSSLWVDHPPGMGFDFIALLPSYCLVFGREYLFLVSSRVLLPVVFL